MQPQPYASQPQVQLVLPEPLLPDTLPQEPQPQEWQPQPEPQPQLPLKVLALATAPAQQGLQQELATKSGNTIPLTPQELQELHAIKISPRD